MKEKNKVHSVFFFPIFTWGFIQIIFSFYFYPQILSKLPCLLYIHIPTFLNRNFRNNSSPKYINIKCIRFRQSSNLLVFQTLKCNRLNWYIHRNHSPNPEEALEGTVTMATRKAIVITRNQSPRAIAAVAGQAVTPPGLISLSPRAQLPRSGLGATTFIQVRVTQQTACPTWVISPPPIRAGEVHSSGTRVTRKLNLTGSGNEAGSSMKGQGHMMTRTNRPRDRLYHKK